MCSVFAEYCSSEGVVGDIVLTDVAGAEGRPTVEAALGLQVAAVGDKAVGARATQGMGSEAHLRSAREQAGTGAQSVQDPIGVDFDLRFAAVQAFSSASNSRKHSRGVHRAMLKLSRACDPLSQHLRASNLGMWRRLQGRSTSRWSGFW